jgi:hypothetical protein
VRLSAFSAGDDEETMLVERKPNKGNLLDVEQPVDKPVTKPKKEALKVKRRVTIKRKPLK